MKYLTAKQILLIHSMVIAETHGAEGVRDMHVILSLEQSPRQQFGGKELYPSVFIKAALYARNIVTSHPFIDGNKRTGMTAAFIFLENNRYVVTAKEGEIEKYAVEIALKKPALEAIALWFEKRVKKS